MGLVLNKDVFFQEYRERFGRLNQSQVAGLEFLLGALEDDAGLEDLRQVAYVLATVKWECANSWHPIDERGSEARFNKLYGPQSRVGKRLGNTEPGDGARFHGRGFCQLTGRANYAKFAARLGVPLTASPELAKRPDVAYRILSDGMRNGLYTGKALGDYITARRADYRQARRIVNGLDRAEEIAAIAEDFEDILRAATGGTPRAVVDVPAPEPAPAPVVIEQAGAVVTTEAAAPTTPVPGGAADDPAVKANSKGLLTKISTWAVGSTGISFIFDQLQKIPGVTIAPEAQVLIVKGIIVFGIVGAVAAVAHHLFTQYIRARPDLQNTK